MGADGNTGHLTLGLDAALSGGRGYARGTVDYLHRIADTPLGEFSAFANGFAGVVNTSGSWVPEAGATAGFGLSW